MTVVALRALGLGDLLTGLPALRGLRRHLPTSRIVLAAPARLEPLARLSGAVDGVVDTAPLGRVRVSRPELAVNLHGRGPESTRTLRAVGPRRLWAFDLDGGPRWRDGATDSGAQGNGGPGSGDPGSGGFDNGGFGEREVERWCRLLAGFGVWCDPDELALPHPDQASRPAPVRGATVVHPGGATPARRWPAGRWGAVARQLAAAGHRVVVTGSRSETGLAHQVAQQAGLPRSAVLAGATDLLDLCALVSRARLVLAADTGIGHLATAYATPSVLLFGPVSPAEWGPPPGRPQHRALWSGQVGDPNSPDPDPGLLSLTATDLLAAVDLLPAAAAA